MTHPAFIAFDTPENTIKGIWVGKFETGYKWANSTSEAEVNKVESESIQIKPNVYSWRNIQVANAFYSSYNYKREYDSHMMKNTEWGAVAYLQHSAYGSAITPSTASVRINNNESYVTGYAGIVEPTIGHTRTNISCITNRNACNEYESTIPKEDGNATLNYLNILSAVASTTGNYSGIYDMSGGSWEYVMGVMLSSDGEPCAGRDVTYTSGFTGPYCNTSGASTGKPLPESKYYDTYIYDTVAERYDRRILGDATGEMGPFLSLSYVSGNARQIGSWYADEASFVWTGYPWFERGGRYHQGLGAGVFAFIYELGHASEDRGFRIVLSIS